MKIADSTTVIERSGVDNTRSYSIKFNAKMAKILSDGIYSDKIRSIIRELSCNALDSHVAAKKKDVPIEVHLPTSFEPWFYVKDFGVGLSEDEVFEIFTTYGESTKASSDDFIGCLGLGSKSPFSYVDAYDVISVKNGIKSQYSMYKDEEGMPSVSKLHSEKTQEANGVTIKMPVKAQDFSSFREKAVKVYSAFSVKPTVIGKALEYPTDKVFMSGKNWTLYESQTIKYYNQHDSVAVARMGNVDYPLDSVQISKESKYTNLCKLNLVVDFNIGDLEVATSREALSYNVRTQNKLKTVLDDIIKDLVKTYQSKIDQCTTEWEAKQLYATMFNNNSSSSYALRSFVANSGLLWKNKKITSSDISFDLDDIYDAKKYPNLHTNGSNMWLRPASRKAYSINVRDKIAIIFDDIDKGGITRSNLHVTSRLVQGYVFNLANSKLTKQQILDLLGNPPSTIVFDTSALPSKTRPSSAGVVRSYALSTTLLNMSVDGFDSFDDSDIDINAGGIYLNNYNNRYQSVVSWDNLEVSSYNLTDIAKYCVQLKILPKNTVIYIPKAYNKDKIKGNSKWKCLWDVISEFVTTNYTDKIRSTINNVEKYNNFDSSYINLNIQGLDNQPFDKRLLNVDWDKYTTKPTNSLLKFKKTIEDLKNASKSLPANYQELQSLNRLLRLNLNSNASSVNFNEIQTAINEIHAEYPHLYHIVAGINHVESSWNRKDYYTVSQLGIITSYIKLVESK